MRMIKNELTIKLHLMKLDETSTPHTHLPFICAYNPMAARFNEMVLPSSPKLSQSLPKLSRAPRWKTTPPRLLPSVSSFSSLQLFSFSLVL